MANVWFYARSAAKVGPFTDARMRELALAGNILPTDTVWLNDSPNGVVAAKVRNLLPRVHAPVAVAPPEPVAVLEPAPVAVAPPAPVPALVAEATDPQHRNQTAHVARKLHAIAITGATVVSQDGKFVRFRKKCTGCKHEDSSYVTLAITIGTMSPAFYCPRCSRSRVVQLRGSQG